MFSAVSEIRLGGALRWYRGCGSNMTRARERGFGSEEKKMKDSTIPIFSTDNPM